MTKPPAKILNAIKKGEAALAAKRKIDRDLAETRAREEARSQERTAEDAAAWVRTELPQIIQARTALGFRNYYLGSCDNDRNWNDATARVAACRNAGLQVESQRYDAENDPDGAYSHGDGYSYTLKW